MKASNAIITHIDLQQNQINDSSLKRVGEYIQDNEYLELLSLANNDITDKGIEILSDYVIGNITLKELDLNTDERITNASVPTLIEMINGSGLTVVSVHFTLISQENQQKITRALNVPIERRQIPIRSNSKSAAKLSL